MSLRVRVAIVLAVVAAACSISAAAVSYEVTTQRIDQEVDLTLKSYVQRFADPDGNLARSLCNANGQNSPDHGAGDGDRDDFESNFSGLPGVTVQCLKSSGQVINSLGPPGVPVPAIDLKVVTGAATPQTERLNGVDYRVVRLASPTGDIIRISRNLEDTDNVMDSVRNRLIAIGLVIAAIAGLVGSIIAKRTVRPIERLTAAAENIAETGDLAVALPAAGSSEIGRLTRAFGGMIEALRTSRDQQQQLVQDAGHELRTPLSSLRTNIDTLRRYPTLEAKQRTRLLDDLDGELRELSTVVDELLALAADRYDDEPGQTVDLVGISEAVAERIGRRSGREIRVTGTAADIEAKPYQLARAISNLVENAVKFSPVGSVIEIHAIEHELTVRDHGAGIASEDLPQVFDRFYRSAAARSLPGSGLGLAIVRQIMERMGGSVSVANADDGGAVFTLHFAAAG